MAWGLGLHANFDVREKLGQIPPADQEVLSHFFKGLLVQGNFASTLFGYRPASLFTHQLSCTLRMMPPPLMTRFLFEYEGWKMWEKYQGLFPIQSFLFQKIPSPEESGSFTILFVHKNKMARILEQYPDLFPDKSMEAALLRVFAQNKPQDSQFHLLQGVLLGYGLENAHAFQEMVKVEDALEFFPYDLRERSDHLSNALLKKRESYEKNFHFHRVWPETNPFFCSKAYGYRAFKAPSDPQIESLQQKIINLYNSDAFLENLLTVITQ
jgi:hypothetical protein